MAKITKTFIDKVALPEQGYRIHWCDAKDPCGFGLRVNAKGTQSFVPQGRLRGVSILFTIGAFGEVTEHQAREEARQIRHGLRFSNLSRLSTALRLATASTFEPTHRATLGTACLGPDCHHAQNP
jgi:hypothetical protein